MPRAIKTWHEAEALLHILDQHDYHVTVQMRPLTITPEGNAHGLYTMTSWAEIEMTEYDEHAAGNIGWLLGLYPENFDPENTYGFQPLWYNKGEPETAMAEFIAMISQRAAILLNEAR